MSEFISDKYRHLKSIQKIFMHKKAVQLDKNRAERLKFTL